jgi:hypothetical protein
MYKYDIITSDNAAGFYTVAQLTQDVLLKSLAAIQPDDYKTEGEILFHLRQNKMLLAHCKQLMAEDKVTSLKAVKNEHN